MAGRPAQTTSSLFFQRKKIALRLITAAILIGMLPVFGVSQTSHAQYGPTTSFAPGLIWIKLAPGHFPAEFPELGASVRQLPDVSWSAFRVPAGSEATLVQALSRRPGVVSVSLDYRAQAFAPFVPNDPEWSQQWSLAQIQMPLAWSLSSATQSVIVATIDSGIQLNHPDLSDHVWTNPREIPDNHIDDDANGKIDDIHGWHFYHTDTSSGFQPKEDADVTDNIGHGTHVAGIIGAATNNGAGVAGIVWKASLMPVKVLDAFGNGWYSDIAAGILYATDNGARVINLSVGGSQTSPLLTSAIDYARNKGVLVVAAAGNNSGQVSFPASYPPVIAVAATDPQGQPADFSNFGPQIDLAAPGTNIRSTWYRSNYFTQSGTSMAAPHVSGVAALLWSLKPELPLKQMETLVLETADDLGPPGIDFYTGYGRVNAFRAVVRMEQLPDLWVKITSPPKVEATSPFTYTIQYGNRGFGIAENVVITATLPVTVTALTAAHWQVGNVSPQSGPFTLSLSVKATNPGRGVSSQVAIATSSPEANGADNLDRWQTRLFSRYFYFFPSISR